MLILLQPMLYCKARVERAGCFTFVAYFIIVTVSVLCLFLASCGLFCIFDYGISGSCLLDFASAEALMKYDKILQT